MRRWFRHAQTPWSHPGHGGIGNSQAAQATPAIADARA